MSVSMCSVGRQVTLTTVKREGDDYLMEKS